jgi:hypothetical protein
MGTFDDKPLFDYLLTDRFISPPESAQHYAEKLAILPHSYQPNDRKRPLGKTPTRKDCHLPEGAFVFCCFNQSFKITPDVFSVWMRLLKTMPNSVLWLLDCNIWAKQNLMREAVLNVSRYDAFQLGEAVLAGDAERTVRILQGLQDEGENAVAVMNPLLWVLRPLVRIKQAEMRGENLTKINGVRLH